MSRVMIYAPCVTEGVSKQRFLPTCPPECCGVGGGECYLSVSAAHAVMERSDGAWHIRRKFQLLVLICVFCC